MRRLATAAIVAIATVFGALNSAQAQCIENLCPPPAPTPPSIRGGLTPLGFYVIGSFGCAAVSPMIMTAVLGRELTVTEVDRMALSCFLGPVGWVLGPVLFPDPVVTPNSPPRNPPSRGTRQTRGRNINIPPPGETRFGREVLLELEPGTPEQYIGDLARALQLTLLARQSFALTGRTLLLFRLDGTGSVSDTLRLVRARHGRVSTGQANFFYGFGQAQPPAQPAANAAQYIVPKLHLLEAHKITSGDDVLVAVIDSKIDTQHPDLAGVVVEEYDALGTPAPAHVHGTGMAGAIAAHTKLIGVAPKVKLLAVRAFTGGAESAQATTFNILKSIDWAASKNVRIINMSFAGPPDPMVRDMLGKAHARGIVLIAAVGNAGPRAPPLYPAADPDVIGVTATDADDKLLPVANRGPQVTLAAPGVQILAPAPDGAYQVTTGTSVAAAHASGVAALLLARNPKLTPDQVRSLMIKSARPVAGNKRDVGAGVIDALGAVNSVKN